MPISSPDAVNGTAGPGTAVLDEAHVGDIKGALGTIALGDVAPRRKLSKKLKTLLAVIGPGLIVMVGDNDAGAFSTYSQAGQDYGTRLLWTLLLLVPVLYVMQEMVVRLGAVTGVGHARLILERFGKFWGAFSVIDLFILNALTIVTEFIGISLAVEYLGLPRVPTVIVAAVLVIVAASTGSFRRFERICVALCLGSLILIPVYLIIHPGLGAMAHGALVPGFPRGAQLSTVMLLIIAIVGTTVAPWQLFFQQSYIVDKRITPRFLRYEKADLMIGIGFVLIGAFALMGLTAGLFTGHPGFGSFTDAGGVATALGHDAGHAAGILFAIALLDASIIGASAVGLSTSYAISDVLSLNHSLHRPVTNAKAFYGCFGALIAIAAALVVIPGIPLGTLTEGVQTLAGVLLPSAGVFLLLLCNDKAVLGPWVNGRGRNAVAAVIIWVLVLLSIVLTASVLFPGISGPAIVAVLAGGAVLGLAGGGVLIAWGRHARTGGRPAGGHDAGAVPAGDKDAWRMPPLHSLSRPVLSVQRKVGLLTLRGYLIVAGALVILKIVQSVTG